MFAERVVLVASSEDESEDDLYKGYNDFNPVLDTRTSRLDSSSALQAVLPADASLYNIQEDDLFRETVNKSSYGRGGNGFGTSGGGLGGKNRLTTSSTAGVAFSRGTALKSRRTSRGTGAGRSGMPTGGVPGTAGGNRPLTAVRGAGYTSGHTGAFDPLNLAANGGQGKNGSSNTGSNFHLTDENTPEVKVKNLEAQINRLLEASVEAAVGRRDYALSLELAKEVVAKERSLSRLKEQSGLLEQAGPNVDLTFAAAFNLAEAYGNAGLYPEAVNAYSAILKNRSFANTGRLRVNIGELLFRQRQYLKAIKYFRMALDTVASNTSGNTPGNGNQAGSTSLRLKLMANIGLCFVRLQQFADAIASFEYIASERGADALDVQTAFHLVLCYYAMGDAEKMKYYFGRLLRVKVEDQFEERYGHHEVLTGSVFATGRTSSVAQSPGPMDRGATPGVEITSAGSGTGRGGASSPVLLIRDEHDHQASLLLEAIRNDRLRQYEKAQLAHVEWCILTAAKLIAPYIERNNGPLAPSAFGPGIYEQSNNSISDFLQSEGSSNAGEDSLGAGYDWCLGQLKQMASGGGASLLTGSGSSALNFSNLADELELYKAVKHLRLRQFEAALSTLKVFEKKDKGTSSSLSNSTGVSSATVRLQPGEVVNGAGSHSAVSRSRSAASASGSYASGFGPPPTPTASQLGGALTPTPQRLNTSSSTTGHSRVAATAATNLSFLYLLQSELDVAARYADEAIAADRYCIGALLNRGNVHYHLGEYSRALDYYREVVASNSNCLEAFYNIALAERQLGNLERALEALFRLRTLTNVPTNNGKGQGQPNLLSQKISNTVSINLLYQIGSIYEAMGNLDQAIDFYTQILNMVPTDVSLLVKLADLASDANDRKQSLSYLNEAYRYLPSHIPTIERLAAAYIEVKMYERAIKYLQQLANIQPSQIKWQLMIAASYRRAGNYQAAFSTYQSVHGRFPDNADCLKFLIRLCTELDGEGRNSSSSGSSKSYGQLAEQYSETLKRLEKSRELREQQAMVAQASSSRSASRASGAASRGYGSGGQRGSPSREGSAATSTSSGGSSSGYITSAKNSGGQKVNNNNGSGGSQRASSNGAAEQRSAISAIVDEVVEQLDSTTLNDRPTTSWSRGRKVYNGSGVSRGGDSAMNGDGAGDDDDLLLDAHLDDILPD